MDLEAVLKFRRSVRVYDQRPIDPMVVKRCLELSTLAPNSSNLQLWQFIHVTDKKTIQKLAKACFGQSAAATADQLVVFITRQDLYKKHAKAVLDFEKDNVRRYSPKDRQEKRIADKTKYYAKLVPFLYARFLGLAGVLRKLMVEVMSWFRPTMHQVLESDLRVVVHKSCALAAQTFMIAMANEGLDTCPMEGYDSRIVKRILKLPRSAEINMIVSCGIRDEEKGIWGDRYRVPFNEVYNRI